MKYSLRTRLSVSYILVALLVVAVLSFMSNFLLEKQFQSYMMRQQEQKNLEVTALISQQYNGKSGSWDKTMIENIGVNALEQGLIVKVRDAAGKTVWDATVHNNGLCLQMINHMARNMTSRYPNFKGGYAENNYPVKHQFTVVGSVDIGYYGPFYLNDNDLSFINTLNRMLISVGVVSLLFALVLGAMMARRISRPISSVIEAARQISEGNFAGRIMEKSGTREIGQLTSTVNNLAETLEKQEKLRKRLTADMAHELRTPLATLQSHMEAMIDGIWEPETERLKSCHEEILRISRMVGDLEKLAQVESENMRLEWTDFDLSDLAQHSLKTFEADFSLKKIETDFQGGKTVITADRDKISQVLVNFLSNALKYTPEGGRVTVTTAADRETAEIRIRDNGIGIREEDLPFIFERFYRADQSRNRKTGGAGIGLAVVKAIVEAHKGTIAVNSKPGQGTEIIVRLPRKI